MRNTILVLLSMLTFSVQAFASDIAGDTRIEERARTSSSRVLNLTECVRDDGSGTVSFNVMSEKTVEKYLVSVNKRCSLGLINCSTTETLISNSSRTDKVVENNQVYFHYDEWKYSEPAMRRCTVERAGYLYQAQLK